jgi:hypothetical protein
MMSRSIHGNTPTISAGGPGWHIEEKKLISGLIQRVYPHFRASFVQTGTGLNVDGQLEISHWQNLSSGFLKGG